MKKRISMTISEEILEKLDSIVDGNIIRSRSEAIESITSQFLSTYRVAVFLGGGSSEKLRIGNTYRPLVNIKGQPLIVHNIKRLASAGFGKIYFVGMSEVVGECFKALGNGEKFGVEINYIEEAEALGNAKTLQHAEKHLRAPFLVLPVDNYFTFDVNYLFEKHLANRALVTVATHATREELTDLGVVEMLGDRIVGYEEKPHKPRTFLTSVFIGMYDPKVFEYIPRGRVRWTLQTDLFPKLIKEGKLYGCMVSSPVFNIHSSEDLKKVKL